MQVVIMRHGRTPANERREYAGSIDVPLSAAGERQALAAGVCADVEKVYVSPLGRARRTARLCFPLARQVVVDGLREMNFGVFEGRSVEEMEQDSAYRAWVDGGCVARCPGGEGQGELVARVAGALEDVVRDASAAGEERVVVVAHGGTIMAAMDAFAESGLGYFAWQVGNCEGYLAEAVLGEEGLRFESWERFSDLGFLDDAARRRVKPPRFAASAFFENRDCEYFPCHDGIAPGEFNCLFCYCPLYALGPECGGNFSYTQRGVKDCTGCTLPHERDGGAALVAERFGELSALACEDAG